MTRESRIIMAVCAAIIAGIALYVLTKTEEAPVPAPPPTAPALTEEQALVLMTARLPYGCKADGEEGSYRTCTVEVVQQGGNAVATVTYDGFFDDSVKASRLEAAFTFDGSWTLGTVTETQQCWPNRGHQDFSAELCV